MVRSKRFLEIYRDENILEYVANTAGPALYNGLLELQKEFPILQNVRGKGLMCAYDLPDNETRNKLLKLLHSQKMLILPCGTLSIRYRPALNVPLEDLARGMDITREALKKI